MKAKLEQLGNVSNKQSFLCYDVVVPAFEFLWHYHPEYELTYIVKGSGKRLIGDSYEHFTEGDLVLLGPHLPHTWVSKKIRKQQCRAMVIQFSAAFITPLFQYPEMKPIEMLLSKAERGIKFQLREKIKFVDLFHKAVDSNGIDAFTSVIQLLQRLTTCKTKLLASLQYKPMKGKENQQRINKVFHYVQQGFGEAISLQRAAAIIYLSESAFCKFFKRASGKTFSDYVNDIRIANACQLLIETDKPVGQIASESGFESLTYFNRVFLKKKRLRPGELRKKSL